MNTSAAAANLLTATRYRDLLWSNNAKPTGASIDQVTIVSKGSGRTEVVSSRLENNQKFGELNKAYAYSNKVYAICEVSTKLADALGNPNDNSSLPNALMGFLNDFKIEQGADMSGARAEIVHSSQIFTNSVTGYVNKMQEIKVDLERDISLVVTNVNNCIDKIVSINQQLASNTKDTDILQARDYLLSELSQYLSINYSFASSGVVTIRTKGGNELVNGNNWSKFSYTPDNDLLNHNDASDVINITTYSSKGKSFNSPVQIKDVRRNFGGELSGLFDVRDNLLPTALSNINNTISQIADKINDLHNRGSGFPPPTSLTSSNAMFLTDSAICKNQIKLGITDNQGKGIKDLNGNYAKPITIDFGTLTSRNGGLSGQFTTQDIINEINQVAAGYGKASVGLGSIATPVGEAPQWLIDQVRLVPNSDVAADGTMTFQLELNSGSDVNTSFQVTDMIVLNQANLPVPQPGAGFVSPAAINVAAGQNTKTGQNIPVRLNEGDNQNIIRLKMCVIGTNGLVDEVWADFNINNGANTLAGAQIMNQRSEAVPSNNAIGGALGGTISQPGGGFPAAATATNAKFGREIVRASFVNANGLSTTDEGYLEISAFGNGLIIDSGTSEVLSPDATRSDMPKNFSHYFNLNNFFTVDALNPASNFAVRNDILSNPGLIALGKANETKVQKNVMVGQTLSSAVLDITVNPVAGQNITIGGTQFNFVAAAAAANDIVIGPNPIATIQNIYVALQTDAMRAQVKATPPNGIDAHLIITAVTQGADIRVASSNGANQWKMPPANALAGTPLGPSVTRLVSGAASAILDCNLNEPQDGDTVTINGMTLTFSARVTPNTVLVGFNVPDSVASLQAVLAASTDPRIAGLVFTIDPAESSQLIVRAKAGFEGNRVTIHSSITTPMFGGGIVNAWVVPNIIGALPATTLMGGFSTATLKDTNTYAIEIGVDSNTNMTNLDGFFSFKEGYSQTISAFVAGFVTDVVRTYNNNKTSSEIANKVADNLHVEYDRITKLLEENKQSLFAYFQESIQYMKLCKSLLSQIREVDDLMLRM